MTSTDKIKNPKIDKAVVAKLIRFFENEGFSFLRASLHLAYVAEVFLKIAAEHEMQQSVQKPLKEIVRNSVIRRPRKGVPSEKTKVKNDLVQR